MHSLYSWSALLNRFASDHLEVPVTQTQKLVSNHLETTGHCGKRRILQLQATGGHCWQLLVVSRWKSGRPLTFKLKAVPSACSSKTLLLWRWMFSICSTVLKFYCSSEHVNCGWPWQPASKQSNNKVCGAAKSLQLISPSNNSPAGPGVHISLATGGCQGSSAVTEAKTSTEGLYKSSQAESAPEVHEEMTLK